MEEKKEVQTYAVINLSAADDSPAYPKLSLNRAGWVAFGTKNLFPQDIINYNSKSPVNASIIESTVTYICGKGVRDSQPNAKKYVGVPNANESWDDLIEKVAKDYKTFGGFYWQVIVNKGSTTVSLFHQDFSQVRIGEITETGKPVTFRISKDWTKTSGKNKPLELPVWPGSVSKAKKGVAYLFYHWDYTPGLNFYCVPGYYPAIEYIKADGTLGQFYNNSIDNGFTPSVVINMPSNPSEEKKAAFQKQMEDAFAGAKGASSIVILWGESDAVKPGITPFNASANADIYNNVEGIVFQKIISAHRLSSPTLAGVSGSGNLSGNAAEIIDAYVLYNYTVIEKLRRKILDKLNVFTKINGTGELFIEDLDVLPKIRETETTTEDVVVEEGAATLSKKDNAVIRLLKRLLFRNAA
ncbi:Phage portal protein [Bacteroides stercorirosoris]|uniref:Phage portal protein n=1 Tax=Bacteroides stercorirosoris TaxID=871324 RepID=A0A1M6L4C3_9BACE|nr:Phage portal protein [Bacteroides stercorirosoris]